MKAIKAWRKGKNIFGIVLLIEFTLLQTDLIDDTQEKPKKKP